MKALFSLPYTACSEILDKKFVSLKWYEQVADQTYYNSEYDDLYDDQSWQWISLCPVPSHARIG